MAESMVFYRSFIEALDGLTDESRLHLLEAIIRYGLDDEEPNLTGVETNLFRLIRPQIDANVKRRENGKKGGRPKKPMVSKLKTNGYENENHRLRNEKPNVNVNVNANANVNENGLNNECITAWGRAQRESDDENPDEDWDLRHQDDGKKYFNDSVKIGLVSRVKQG